MNKEIRQSISEKVLTKIKNGRIKMHSKVHFILKSVLLVLGIIITLAVALYLISFILFILQRSGFWFLPRYGLRSMRLLLGGFPWILLLALVFFVFLLEILIKHYRIAYKKPLLYSALVIILFIIITGLFIHKTHFQGYIYNQNQERHMPLAPFYRRFEMPQPDMVHPGIISEITDNGFILERRDGKILEIIISDKNRFFQKEEINKRDQVLVIGELKDDIISAIGIHKLPDGNNFPQPMKKPPAKPGLK